MPGFAYNPGGKGTFAIRGGFGIYYSQITDNSQANYTLTGPTGVFNYTAAPGQIGFPAGVSAVPLPAFPAGGRASAQSVYSTGREPISVTVFPRFHAHWVP